MTSSLNLKTAFDRELNSLPSNTSRAKNFCHFPSIINVCLKASENLFRKVLPASELPNAGTMLFILAKLFDG